MPACVCACVRGWVGLFVLFGLNKVLFIHRKHKLNKQVQKTQKQYAVCVTYRYNDNHTDNYDGKMANCCQNVRGNKTKTKMTTKTKPKKHLFVVVLVFVFCCCCCCCCFVVVCCCFRRSFVILFRFFLFAFILSLKKYFTVTCR